MTSNSDVASQCIYCLGRRGDPILTEEHIWPSALGGKAAPTIFQTKSVCRRCNNLAGLFVDGPFLKCWFIQNEGLNGQQFLDPKRPSATSLVYLGFEKDFPTDSSEVCERWIGPAGEHIYHIHAKDDARWDTIAGGDFIRRKSSDGRAYIVMTSQSQYWIHTGLLSFSEWFPYAKKRCVTHIIGSLSGIDILTREEQPLTERENIEIAYISGRVEGHQVLANFPIKVDFADRFLAKVALGLTGTLLGERALKSPYADDLRRALWSRTSAERENLSLKGAGYWTEKNQLFSDFLGNSGAWTIALHVFPEGLSYTALSPSGKALTMGISDDATLWPPKIGPAFREGVVYIAIPERQKWWGPIPLPNVIAHKLGHHREEALVELEDLRTLGKSLPPKR
jgi:HNH endonuclease